MKELSKELIEAIQAMGIVEVVMGGYMGKLKLHFKDFVLTPEVQSDSISIFKNKFKFRPGVLAFSSLRGLDAPF